MSAAQAATVKPLPNYYFASPFRYLLEETDHMCSASSQHHDHASYPDACTCTLHPNSTPTLIHIPALPPQVRSGLQSRLLSSQAPSSNPDPSQISKYNLQSCTLQTLTLTLILTLTLTLQTLTLTHTLQTLTLTHVGHL